MATVSIVPPCHIVALSVGAHLCHIVKHCGEAQKLTGENLFLFLPKGENTIVASKKREDGERGVGDFEKCFFVQKTGEKTYNVCLNNLHCGCGCVAGKLEIPNG